jgi:hypothetical protein
MLSTFLAALRAHTSNDYPETQRRHPRRVNDRCVVVIHGRAFPVENWSFGGLLLSADDRLFGLNQSIDLTLKFKLRNTIIDIDHRATIVRKSPGRVALEFEPLNKTVRRAFQQVVDDAVASEFATSQI